MHLLSITFVAVSIYGSDLRPANISTICNVSFVSLKQGSFILSLTQQTVYNNNAS